MENLTEKEVETLSHVLRAEGMACKKARMYSHTLTDTELAEEMATIAADHEERYKNIYFTLSGTEF